MGDGSSFLLVVYRNVVRAKPEWGSAFFSGPAVLLHGKRTRQFAHSQNVRASNYQTLGA